MARTRSAHEAVEATARDPKRSEVDALTAMPSRSHRYIPAVAIEAPGTHNPRLRAASPLRRGYALKVKLCMVGAYAVGKTSLVERFVHSIYSERYHTTIGVKIDTKEVETRDGTATCVIWDIAGEDEFYTVRSSYLRGMRGYLLVVDGTRRLTVDVAQGIHDRITTAFGPVPFVLLANKTDLQDAWELREDDLDALASEALAVLETSALTGACVEDAFDLLLGAIVDE